MLKNLKFPHILLILYCIWFALLAIDPYHRGYWLAANISPIFITLFFVMSYRRFQFSNLSYLLISFLLFFQTLGAHFFFHRVPFDLITEFFNFTRHNFDRMVHLFVGFYAYPVAELIKRKKIVFPDGVVYLFSFSLVMTAAGFYEILEWLYVILVSPGSDADFLGAQGDIWDAQKDMMCDGVGALMAMIIFYIKSYFSSKRT